jgi:hypothetical protein
MLLVIGTLVSLPRFETKQVFRSLKKIHIYVSYETGGTCKRYKLIFFKAGHPVAFL